jgi:hypothetical protein
VERAGPVVARPVVVAMRAPAVAGVVAAAIRAAVVAGVVVAAMRALLVVVSPPVVVPVVVGSLAHARRHRPGQAGAPAAGTRGRRRHSGEQHDGERDAEYEGHDRDAARLARPRSARRAVFGHRGDHRNRKTAARPQVAVRTDGLLSSLAGSARGRADQLSGAGRAHRLSVGRLIVRDRQDVAGLRVEAEGRAAPVDGTIT